jgi:hypothetical protein
VQFLASQDDSVDKGRLAWIIEIQIENHAVTKESNWLETAREAGA